MAAPTHGSQSRLLWGAADVSAYFQRVGVERSRDTHDATTFGVASREYQPGLHDATLTAEGTFVVAGVGEPSASADVLDAALSAPKSVVSHYPAGYLIGQFGWAMEAVETSYVLTSPTDDVNRVTAEAQSRVAAERVVSLMALTTTTAGGTTTPIDSGAASQDGLSAYAHVTEVIGTPSEATVAAVQHSSDASTWADLISFPITGPGATRGRAVGTVQRHLRMRVARGTATSHTCQVGVSRNPMGA